MQRGVHHHAEVGGATHPAILLYRDYDAMGKLARAGPLLGGHQWHLPCPDCRLFCSWMAAAILLERWLLAHPCSCSQELGKPIVAVTEKDAKIFAQRIGKKGTTRFLTYAQNKFKQLATAMENLPLFTDFYRG